MIGRRRNAPLIGGKRAGVLSVVAVGGLLFLSGCGETDTDRRFANQTPLPENATATSSAMAPKTASTAPDVVAPTPIPAPALLREVGANPVVFSRFNDAIWATPADSGISVKLYQPTAGTLLSVAGSPDGVHVVAVERTYDGGLDLVIIDAAGQLTQRTQLIAGSGTPAATPMAKPQATPVAAATPEPVLVAWSPSGDRVLVALPGRGLAVAQLGGELRSVVAPVAGERIDAIGWSDGGDAIAYAALMPDGSSGLFVTAVGTMSADPARIVTLPASRASSISEVAWLAGAPAIIFAQRPSGPGAPNGDLFSVPPGGGRVVLMAAAGVAAPVAEVDLFASSPSGLSLAYTVALPASAGAAFHSLWIQQVNGATLQRVDIPAGESVDGLWWTTAGLVWRTMAADGIARFYRMGADSTIQRFSQIGAEATPVASPQASPVG